MPQTKSKNKDKLKNAAEEIESLKAYDDVPYLSRPFTQTNPLHLQSIAKLFGLDVPTPQKARIMEIGCASGNNIIAMATLFPDSKCIGFDYSEKQIAHGQKEVKALGLKNIELKHLSVMNVEKDFGEFDYIICHGVLSWVPVEVQDKILEVCGANLAKDGIAYVSYNTLPGWNSVRTVRDMMMYHTKRFPDAATKAQQARSLLKFIGESMKANNNPMANFIETEMKILQNNADYYLLHEHLEENNFQFYFHEVMEKASKNGLQYLGDINLESMYSGNFSPAIKEVLATSNDLVRTEQYMDFITNRRFRSTIFCHSDRILNRNIKPEVLKGNWVVSRFKYPDGYADKDIYNKTSFQFHSPNNMTLTSDEPIVLAMMKVLIKEGNKPINVDELVKQTTAYLKKGKYAFPDHEEETMEKRIHLYLLRYIFMGGIQFIAQGAQYLTELQAKPKVAELTRYQAMNQEWTTNRRMESMNVTAFDKVLLKYLDGTNDIEALEEKLMPHFESSELVLNEENTAITDMKKIKKKLRPILEKTLERYVELGLFV